jgi:hypothetical protein
MINKYRIDWLLMEQTTDDFNTVCDSIYTKIQTLLYIPIGKYCLLARERDRRIDKDMILRKMVKRC